MMTIAELREQTEARCKLKKEQDAYCKTCHASGLDCINEACTIYHTKEAIRIIDMLLAEIKELKK